METTLRAGQVWSYGSRPEDAGSRLTVLHVETLPQVGEVVHVALDGLRLPNPVRPEHPGTTIGHLPLAAGPLRRSLIELVGHTDEPPDLAGYEQWREAQGGVFTIGVADAVRAVVATLT